MNQIDFGALISRAATATWRFRFLWLFAVLAGSGGLDASFSTNFNVSSPVGGGNSSSSDGRAMLQMAEWLASNAWIIIFFIAFLIAIGLALTVLSIICQGALARATLDTADEKPVTFGEAWSAGLQLFWRFFRLRLLFFLVGLVIVLVIGLVGVVIALAGDFRILFIIPAVMAAILAAVVAIPVWIVMAIVVPLAMRILADEDISVVGALIFGWRLFRATVGASLLTWIISVALGLGIGLLTVIPILLTGGMMVAGGLAIWAVLGASVLLVIYGIFCGVFISLIAVVLGIIANTFFWHYWTLAYRQLQTLAAPAYP